MYAKNMRKDQYILYPHKFNIYTRIITSYVYIYIYTSTCHVGLLMSCIIPVHKPDVTYLMGVRGLKSKYHQFLQFPVDFQ